jgi:hypothetical protein
MPSFIPATGRTQHVAGVCLNRIGKHHSNTHTSNSALRNPRKSPFFPCATAVSSFCPACQKSAISVPEERAFLLQCSRRARLASKCQKSALFMSGPLSATRDVWTRSSALVAWSLPRCRHPRCGIVSAWTRSATGRLSLVPTCNIPAL